MDHMPAVKNLEFLGSLSMQETLDAMKRAKCVIVPSICYETFARAIIEAYACGVPVIASDIGALKERVIDGQTGFLFRAGDPFQLQEKVQRIFNQDNQDTQLGKNARAQYEEHYTPEENYTILMEIYKDVIRKSLQENILADDFS